MSNNSVTVQLPASTSNCGPGFDTLSIALKLYNFVKVELAVEGGIRAINPEAMPGETQEMVTEVAKSFEQLTGNVCEHFTYDIWGEVPMARGLGSSATVRAGIFAALNSLMGSPLSLKQLVSATALADHAPDNVSALFHGGFVVSRSDPYTGEYKDSVSFPVSEELSMVVVSPDIKVRTKDARELLPDTFPFRDAVRSLNSSSYIVACFASGDYERLKHAVCDFMHEPYRARLCPFVSEAINAGNAVGAYAGWLSGSGSSVLCVAPRSAALEVGKAMSSVYIQNGVANRLFTLKVDNQGIQYL